MAPGDVNFMRRGIAGRCRVRLRPLSEVADLAAPLLHFGFLLPNIGLSVSRVRHGNRMNGTGAGEQRVVRRELRMGGSR